MPAALRKALIAMGTAMLVVFIYMFFDPTLRDFIYAAIISAYLMVFKVVVGFTFKKGVISFATIAWKRIFFVGGAALFRRFWIDFLKKNATEHIAKPLMPHARRWLKVHLEDFKDQPLWLKVSESTAGAIVIGAVAWFFGLLSYIWTLVEKVLTGKFQSFFLSILGMFTRMLGFLWDKIKPWLDVILITALFNAIEKVPFVQKLFHRGKKVKQTVVEKKDAAIKKVVHAPVQKMAAAIDNHTEKKIQKRNGKNGAAEVA